MRGSQPWHSLLSKWRKKRPPKHHDALAEADCTTIRELAWSHLNQNNVEEAFDIVNDLIERLESEGLADDNDPAFQIAACYRQLAHFYASTRQPEQVPAPASKAIEMLEEIDDDVARGSLSAVLGDLSSAYYNQGRIDQAMETVLRSLEIERALRRKREIISPLLTLAAILTRQQRYDEANTSYCEALQAARASDDPGLEGTVLQHHGRLLLRRNALHEAKARFEQAITLFRSAEQPGDRSTDNLREEMHTCALLARVEAQLDKPDSAEEWYQHSRTLAEHSGDRQQLAAVAHQLGLLYQTRAAEVSDKQRRSQWLGQASEALEHSLAMQLELDNKRAVAALYYALGTINQQLGQLAQAEQYLLKATEIGEILDLPRLHEGYQALAEIAQAQGYPEIARHWRTRYQDQITAMQKNRGLDT